MKRCFYLLFIVTFLFAQSLVYAQFTERQDVVWARMVTAGTITLDGNLDEAAWDQASVVDIIYGQPGPLPTSAWRPEFQEDAITDPTNAKVRFLVSDDNQLYLAFEIPDSSIGGTQDWARWDGILMSIKDKRDTARAANAIEYFYTWWYQNIPTYVVPGAPPRFVGRYGNFDDTTRTPEQVEAWDAGYVINGISNDAGRDEGWTVEMRINLDTIGYDVTRTEGDVIALNLSIWDCDYLFEGDMSKVSTTRTWFQSPWGNANAMNVARVFGRPDVTTSTVDLPEVEPDVVLPNGADFTDPVIDGDLNDPVWVGAYSFDIAWGDKALRESYPTTGPLSSGQWQPELGGNPRPPVIDPSFATIKMFFKDNFLYLSADVSDQLVQGTEEYDKIDGVSFIIGDREKITLDNNMVFQRLRVSFNVSGEAAAYDYLPVLDSAATEFAVILKGSTTVNDNSDVDEGYQMEIKVDLTDLGYPADLGDKLLFMGVMLADGDTFEDPLANYGTRTWWFREHDGGPAAAWMVMDPENLIVDVEDEVNQLIPASFELYGNYPNPFNPSTSIKFAVPETGNINLAVYNTLGEVISNINLPVKTAGIHEYRFNAGNITSGVYFYRVTFSNDSRTVETSNIGKMILLK